MLLIGRLYAVLGTTSMKALPKRKGNPCIFHVAVLDRLDLNESPSKKEGKCYALTRSRGSAEASMKALPKRKGNT